MVQTSAGTANNEWISFMRACSAEYKRQKAVRQSSAHQGCQSGEGRADAADRVQAFVLGAIAAESDPPAHDADIDSLEPSVKRARC